MKINKKGAEKILSVYWFVILIIIAGGIFGMVYVFYGYPYDFRDIEARTITTQVADCVSQGGQLKINMSNFDILRDCNLNFEDSNYNEIQYYNQVSFFDINGNKISESSAGNMNLISSCEIENENYKKLAKCNNEKFYSTLNGQGVVIKVLSIVRKTEKNTK
jgi:hypothetical protein